MSAVRDLFAELKDFIDQAVSELAPAPPGRTPVEFPPDPELGDLATPVALALARTLRRPPRQIAEDLARRLARAPGVVSATVAGPGYVNLHLDRTALLRSLLSPAPAPRAPTLGKAIVEHTNINPNKAAHIGHLRNAVLGDALARCLRALGWGVEVQNYIDDTGVQVADVAVALSQLAGFDEAGFRELEARAEARRGDGGHGVDYDLWDLYAQVTRWYDEDPARVALRAEALRQLECGEGALGRLGVAVAPAVVACHLRTMERLDIRYDLLPKESDILAHRFWDHAFARLRESRAIILSAEGKSAGCWIMNLPHAADGPGGEEYEKIIVRSDGTVTYVGKDIAYQMWKFGLLGRDFAYRKLPGFTNTSGGPLWETAPPGAGEAAAPGFGRADKVYNVIDVRQSYLQRVVQQGLERLGHTREAQQSVHFSYEMVALTPRTALELQPDLVLDEDERRRPFIDMSGRRGIGVKADDLLDRLDEKALAEVRSRNPDFPPEEQARLGRSVARGALRYYMLRFARNTLVAFDIDGALAFEGETGPYCQYACVRVGRIVEKLAARLALPEDEVRRAAAAASFDDIPADSAAEHWRLVQAASRLPDIVRAAVDSLEFSTLARYAFDLAQEINAFYHRWSVLHEADDDARAARLAVLLAADQALRTALELMGAPPPARM